MIIKGSDIKVGQVFQRSGYTMEILEIISDNGKTLKVKTMSETKKGHKQQDVFNLRKTTNLKKI
jgi:hypothetical protein|tara:strand:- start:2146 stop:2337 length:192 start_codon:yes stop_codon:yes gene_type:complete